MHALCYSSHTLCMVTPPNKGATRVCSIQVLASSLFNIEKGKFIHVVMGLSRYKGRGREDERLSVEQKECHHHNGHKGMMRFRVHDTHRIIAR